MLKLIMKWSQRKGFWNLALQHLLLETAPVSVPHNLCLCIHGHTIFSSRISILRPPNCRAGWVWTEVKELVSSPIILVYLCEVMHTQATKLFCYGTLTLQNVNGKKQLFKTSKKEHKKWSNTLNLSFFFYFLTIQLDRHTVQWWITTPQQNLTWEDNKTLSHNWICYPPYFSKKMIYCSHKNPLTMLP